MSKKEVNENFPSYVRNFFEVKKLPDDTLSELELIRYKKTVDKSKYSVNMLRYALLLRYTSVQAYKLMLEQFPLPSLRLLKKLTEGGIEPLKATKVLLEQRKIGTDVVLLLDACLLIYKNTHNTRMRNLLVLSTKEICTKVLWHLC